MYISQSKYLKECFSELDIPGASTVDIVMAPVAPFLSLTAEGDSVTCKVQKSLQLSLVNLYLKKRAIHIYR